MLALFITLSISLSLIIMMLSSNLASQTKTSLEKNSPFECGFNPMYKSRIPFSLQFFLITLIFIIFDVEIILIMPLTLFNYKNMMTAISGLTILIILTIGLFHEWNEGSLNWL